MDGLRHSYREVKNEFGIRSVDNADSSFGSLSQVDEAVRKLLLRPNEIGKCRENPLTQRGKQMQLCKMLLLILIPIMSLAVLAVLDLNAIARNNNVNVEVRNVIRFSRDIGMLLSRLQRERDMAALYVSAIGSENNIYLIETYPLTDIALDELDYWPVETSVLKELPFFRKKSDFKEHLATHRANLKRNDTTVYNEIDFYTSALQIFIDWLYESVGNSKGHAIWQTLVAYQLLIVSNVDTGIERTLGSVFFAKGQFDRHEDYVWYLDMYNMGRWNFMASKRYSELVNELYDKEATDMSDDFTENIDRMRNEILEYGDVMYSATRDPNFTDATTWFDSMSVYIQILETVQKNMADEILARLERDLESDIKAIAISISLVIIVILMCPLILRAFWSLTTDIHNCALALADQTKAFNKEKRRGNHILHSMMPKTVADHFVNDRNIGAKFYQSATIFFSDIPGFDRLCSESSPMQVVEMINGLYLVFDSRIENYEVYKVETINETYMLASGLPKKTDWCHTAELATTALDLVYHACCLEVPHKKHVTIKLRVGLHTGPVVAGIVGLKIPRYFMFGETVNTALRMKATGQPMRVQISENTYLALLEVGGFTMRKRGAVEIKGQGMVNTYWLTDKDDLHQLIAQADPIHMSKPDGHLNKQEHKYDHMYENTYISHIRYGKDRRQESLLDFMYSL
ncbi:uncharacterized protein [Amphiura filiformis]|uniref:uncharacterized protein n=1 Tax=Amphiura filiformis TaxID=82378 RepID=UPI003B2270B3